jgi:hypothetical protein
MITAEVRALPIGFVVAYTNDSQYSGYLGDADAAGTLTFAARFRAVEYAALLEWYYRAIDERRMRDAAELGEQMKEHRRQYGRAWQNAETTRYPTKVGA